MSNREGSGESRPLVHGGGRWAFCSTLALSYGFYLTLGDPTDPFDLVTGAVSAGLVAAVLASVAVRPTPSVRTLTLRAGRGTLFLPYLLWEIGRANVGVASVILDPELPVDPEVVAFDPAATETFERAVLGNAITLTPGTVTITADEDQFRVHTLTAGTREGLTAGSLRRAVQWVFHGRDDR